MSYFLTLLRVVSAVIMLIFLFLSYNMRLFLYYVMDGSKLQTDALFPVLSCLTWLGIPPQYCYKKKFEESKGHYHMIADTPEQIHLKEASELQSNVSDTDSGGQNSKLPLWVSTVNRFLLKQICLCDICISCIYRRMVLQYFGINLRWGTT